MGKVWYFL